MPRAQLVEVAQELVDADALLHAAAAQAREHVVQVLGLQLRHVRLHRLRLRLREVVVRVVEVTAHSEDIFRAVHVIAELNVVDLAGVSLVHVVFQEQVQDLFVRIEPVQVENAYELCL